MSARTLNLGILAHVDAGKTTLTERLLYAAGVIDRVGSVDAGTTQTDSLALERRRGITIRSAVATFALPPDLTVNLIDTPGHPDFIAEVERVLSVLDGAIMVVSAVEGVQPQTRILMRALRRLGVPTLLFLNKVDRRGADVERALGAVTRRLAGAPVPLGTVRAAGTRDARVEPFDAADPVARARLAEALADRDEPLLAAYVEDPGAIPYPRLHHALVTQTRRGLVQPVFFGAAATGAGIEPLLAGIAELLPAVRGDHDGPVAGTVFKIERGASGEKIAVVRMFAGTVRVRDRVVFGDGAEAKVTALKPAAVSAGQIGRLWGLAQVRVGDRIGAGAGEHRRWFPPPALASVVVADDPADRARLRAALAQLAEQDPLIDVHQDDRGEQSVALYGEVQQEVLQATLEADYGVRATFRPPTTICVERVAGTGSAAEVLCALTPANVVGRSSPDSDNPYAATLGLRVQPAAPGRGVEVRVEVPVGLIPLYVYRTVGAFGDMLGRYVRDALRVGPAGWRVTDCVVTVQESGYIPPLSTAGDFRKLTPLVLSQALARAGTQVCHPMARARVETPTDSVGAVLAAVGRLAGTVAASAPRGELTEITTVLPAARLPQLQRALPGLTGGEATVESEPAGYRPLG